MEKQVVAVIGCGRIAQTHLDALSHLTDIVRVKYGCDLIEEKAVQSKQSFPIIEQVITDYQIALADPEVKAVFVLTPNYAHYTITMDALRAGKHVFCEKPITVNYALSLEMAEEANKRGLMLNIGVCNRYHRSVELLAEMNQRGEFGKIYHAVVHFRSSRSIPGLGGPFTTKAQSGGGVLIDWGVHYLDLVLYILGSPTLKTVSADAYCEMAKDMKSYKYHGMWADNTMDIENGTNDVDDFISGHIRTDKANITFTGAWAQNLPDEKNETYIDLLGDKKGVRLRYCGQFTTFDGDTLQATESTHEIPNMYEKEDEAFLHAIFDGVKTKAHIDNILESAKLLDYLYQSAEKHAEIAL